MDDETLEEIVEDELYITEKGTIKSKNGTFREMKVNRFIKKLDRKLSKCEIYANDKNEIVKFDYPLSVTLDKEGFYHIKIDDKKYSLSAFSAPRLSVKLDECVEATTIRVSKISYEDITHCHESYLYLIPNKKEYLKALKILAPAEDKDKLYSFLASILLVLGGAGGFCCATTFGIGLLNGVISIPLGLGGMALSLVLAAVNMYIGVIFENKSFCYGSVRHLLKKCEGLSLDKQIEKMEELVKKYPNEDPETVMLREKNYAPGDGHTAGIHQYISMITKATDDKRMNNRDKLEVLEELKAITNKYDKEIEEVGVDEMKLLGETLDKLTALELKINGILKQDSRNEIVQKVHNETMREIDARIKKASEEEQKVAVASGGGRGK